MKVVLCSAFRNSAATIDRYFEQVDGLALRLETEGDTLHLILGYGDSTDDTAYVLSRYAAASPCRTDLVECSHGGPVYSSVVNPTRFRQLAHVGNALFRRIPADADAVLWVESDLVWLPSTLTNLVEQLAAYPAVAPLILDGPDSFYDTYAFVCNGAHFTKARPFHPDLNGEMLQVDSAGSCLALRGVLARQLHVPDEDVIVGVCRQVYALGGSVWVMPDLFVEHP